MICAGIDAGSRTIKVVLVEAETLAVLAAGAVDQGVEQGALALGLLDRLCADSGVPRKRLRSVVATGYGRKLIDTAHETITEITCQAWGVRRCVPGVRTIVDIGGQDNKVIVVTDAGQRRNFKMNRKCAAGTGAFLEEIAAQLDTPLAQLNELAARATSRVELGSFCTVFAKTELLALIAQGTPLPEMARAAFRSVAKRIMEMDPLDGQVVMTGGVVAHNPVIVDLVKEALGRPVLVPDHPSTPGPWAPR